MKKILILLALLLPFAALADNVSEEKAKTYAQKFLGRTNKVSTVAVNRLKDNGLATTSKMQTPAYYIFNADGGGFVIISAEDAVSPVLAYSDTGTFKTEGMPENLAFWMGQMRDEINMVRTNKVVATAEVKEEWNILETKGTTPSYASELLLETALWDQMEPYNGKCPMDGSKRSVTGCVATATSIVMRYHKWPEAGHGTLPGYDSQKGHALGHTYDWNNMPLKYQSGKYTQEQADQVAQLMFDVGIMAQMSYSSSGSGAITAIVAPGLEKYMYYDASVRFEHKGFYSDSQWLEKIKNELQNVGPFVYSGRSNSGGHAFVIDGYDSANKLHVNWGWSGSDNGYFAVSTMGGFSSDCGAIFNMKPDAGGKSEKGAAAYSEMTTGGDAIVPGKAFQVFITDVRAAYRDCEVVLGVGLFSKDGKFQKLVSETGSLDLGLTYYYPKISFDECKIDGNISSGDYLKLVYGNDGSEPSIPAIFNAEDGGKETISLDLPVLKYTSFEYDATKRIVTVTFNLDYNTSFSLKTSTGSAVKSGVKASGKTFTIDKNVVPSGDYVLSITAGWTTEDFSFTL